MSKFEVYNKTTNEVNFNLTLDGKFKSIQINGQYFVYFQGGKLNHIRISFRTKKYSYCQIDFMKHLNFKEHISIRAESLKEDKLIKFIKNKLLSDIDYNKIDSPDKYLHFIKNRLTRVKSRKLLSI